MRDAEPEATVYNQQVDSGRVGREVIALLALTLACGASAPGGPEAGSASDGVLLPGPSTSAGSADANACTAGACLSIRVVDAGGWDIALCTYVGRDGMVDVAGHSSSVSPSPPGAAPFWMTIDETGAIAANDTSGAKGMSASTCAFDVTGDLRLVSDVRDVTVVRMNRGGGVAWSTTLPLLVPFDSTSTASAPGVAVDDDGDTLVVGNYQAAGRDLEAALFKLDPRGQLVWTAKLSTVSFDYAYGVATDPAGDAYVVGFLAGAAVLAKVSPAGEMVWTRSVPITGGAWAVAVDPRGAVYVAGNSSRTMFLFRFEPTGAETWRLPVGDDLSSVHIAVDPAGKPWMVGQTLSATSTSVFAARFDVSGTMEWFRKIGTGTSDDVEALAFDSNGNGHLAGSTAGSFANPGEFVAAGGSDAFEAVFDASGHVR